jgi:hypothetical protein
VPDAAAPLDVAAAAAVVEAVLADAADEEDLLMELLLLLETFLPLPLLDGAMAEEAVTTVAAIACVGFHLEGLSPT